MLRSWQDSYKILLGIFTRVTLANDKLTQDVTGLTTANNRLTQVCQKFERSYCWFNNN